MQRHLYNPHFKDKYWPVFIITMSSFKGLADGSQEWLLGHHSEREMQEERQASCRMGSRLSMQLLTSRDRFQSSYFPLTSIK